MASDTRCSVTIRPRGCSDSVTDPLGKIGVAFQTGRFGYLEVATANPDRLIEAAGRKVEGVPETIACLGRVLADQTCRSVAIVTGDRKSTRLNSSHRT